MPNEIYHRSNWGNANAEGFGDVYFDAAATNKLYNRSDYYENSDGTDATLKDLSNKASIVLTPTAYSDGSLNTVIPTDGNGDFDFSRGSSATRVNEKGLIEDVQILSGELVQNGDFEQIGSELVTNGNFYTDSDWTATYNELQSSIIISNNQLSFTSTVPYGFAKQEINVTSGKTYKMLVDIDNFSGSMRMFSESGNDAKTISSTGLIEFYFVPDANTTLIGFSANNDIGASVVVNSISVKEVGQNWSFGTGWSMGDGVALFDSSGIAGYIIQSNALQVGKKYKLTANVNKGTVSLIQAFYNIQQGENIQTGVDSIFTVTSGTDLRLYSHPNNGDAEITNISVIEVTDDTDLPRIDYTDGEGSLLLEPQRTNEIIYSNGFDDSSWQKSALNVTANAGISPDGTNNAYLIEAQSNTSQHRVRKAGSPPTTVSVSIFAKKGTTDYAYFFCGGGSRAIQAIFDLSDGSVTDSSGLNATLTSASSVSLGNGWYRLQLSGSFVTAPANRIGIIPYYQSTINGNPDTGWLGSGESIYIYGAMEEDGAYVSSYIPTTSSTVTRSADVANNSGNADLINSTEGVLYFEGSALANDGTNRRITISDGTNSNKVIIGFDANLNRFIYHFYSDGVASALLYTTLTDITNFSKYAVKWKLNDFAIWVNGVEVANDNSGNVPNLNTFNVLKFSGATVFSPFYGKTKCVAVFKEALTDEELQELTS